MQSILLALAFLALSATQIRACNITHIRNLASQGSMPGGWTTAEVNNANINTLMNIAASGVNGVSRGVHVLEAYQQVVAGMNYCILFTAASHCDSSAYCQSSECTAGGYSNLQGQLTPGNIQCEKTTVCNIEEIRESANNNLLGGWRKVSSDNNAVLNTIGKATAIAGVQRGTIVEAYSQVVNGNNYCIGFQSIESNNCLSNCQGAACVAGGYQPFNGKLQKIAVKCEQRGNLSRSNGAGDGRISLMSTCILVIFTLILLLTL